MNIVLLNTCAISRPTDHLQRVDPHLRVGVAVIAACLRRAGHAVRILDPRVQDGSPGQFAEQITKDQPDIVGLSAFTEEIADAADIAGAVKAIRPETRTVVGGYHASATPLETLREFPMFDMAVVGEGEMPMLELAGGNAPASIAGLVWREDGGAVRTNAVRRDFPAFEDLPPPAWDLYDLALYGYRLPVEPSRTCPFRCSFCFQATSDKTRYKAPERIVDEVEEAVRRHGARELSFASAGAFPLNRTHGLAVCNGLISRNLRLPWFTTTRADKLDRELLTAMRDSGCRYVSLGIESGDQEMLSRCNKGLNLEQAEETIRLIHEVGIESEICFVLGLPGETPASLAKTRRFAMKMRPYATLASFAILTPFPGTDVFRMAECGAEGLGLVTRDWHLYSKNSGTALSHGAFTVRQLKRLQARMYMEFYLGSPVKALRLLGSKNMREVLSLRRFLTLLGRML
jgi:radical SAM superfamily enzyme YgiQ (UPF0313 family)